MTHLSRALRALVWSIAIAGAMLLTAGQPALAATAPITVAKLTATLPAGTTAAWISVESGGVDAAQLTVITAAGTATGAKTAVSPTSFGAGAVVDATPTAFTLYVASAKAIVPDIAITAVDGDGRILSVTSARVDLAANPATDPSKIIGGGTVVDVDTTTPQGTSPQGTSPDAGARPIGNLESSGGTLAWSLIVAAAALVVGGTGLVLYRRHVSRRAKGGQL